MALHSNYTRAMTFENFCQPALAEAIILQFLSKIPPPNPDSPSRPAAPPAKRAPPAAETPPPGSVVMALPSVKILKSPIYGELMQ